MSDLDRIFFEASQLDMTKPVNKAHIAKRALPIIKNLDPENQVQWVKKLCETCHVDSVQIAAMMLLNP